MHQAARSDAQTPRGSELLRDFLDLAVRLAELTGPGERQLWATIRLVAHTWDCVRHAVGDLDGRFGLQVACDLRRRSDLVGETNLAVACGLLVMSLAIEAARLDDPDAGLVRSLTALQVARARIGAFIPA